MNREYKNPIAEKGDFADPFVLRYNGIYYLYATNHDIRCFRSENLVDWSLEGPVIEPGTFGELVPFAPEVVYHDGKFYMYTSPSGFGHYVLESDFPTGPFRKISENVGHAIDGTVFIDDDGKWYFYWASDKGIFGCEMKSPTEFLEPVLTGAYLNGWTEGPFIQKRDGIYSMTYTGNHYLSKGYRIQAAWSKEPLSGYQDDLYNPVIVHTKGEGVGLGHSSTVAGPDLVSHYIVYHNLNEDATRDLDIDRILWQQEATQVFGPTRTAQKAPSLPDASFPALKEGKELLWEFEKGSWKERDGIFYSSSGGLRIKSEIELRKNFTAELHLLIPHGNENCGVELEAENKTRFAVCFLHHKIIIYRSNRSDKDKKMLLKEMDLLRCSIYDVLHKIGIQMNKGRLSVYFDNRNVLETDIYESITSIGYFSDDMPVGIGYTAVTNAIYHEETEQVEIPAGCSFLPVCGKGDGDVDEKGGVTLRDGQKKEYKVRVDSDGMYTVYITVNQSESSRLEIELDKRETFECFGCSGLQKVGFWMERGVHCITLKAAAGKTLLKRLEIAEQGKISACIEKLNLAAGPYGKILLEDTTGDDYTIEMNFVVRVFGENGSAGVLIRVSEPSEGGEGGDLVLGIDFFRGYSVSVDGSVLKISKHCYDRKILGEIEYMVETNREYKLSVTVRGNEIIVSNETKGEIIKVMDEDPLVKGCAGLWTENSSIEMVKFLYTSI